MSQTSAPNVTLFNHDVMNCTADGVVGNYLYSARALGLTQKGDKIQLHPELKTQLEAALRHYQRVGLEVCEDFIWDLDRKHFADSPTHRPSVFYFGPNEALHWHEPVWLETVEYINSKNNFMALAQKLDVDVPLTLCFDRPAEISAEQVQKWQYPLYVKAAVSVSGVGIFRCANASEALAAIESFAADVPLQIQEEVITDTFLNLQYRIVNGKAERLVASEQILDGFAHQGNRVPASHEPWESVDPMAAWLAENGMQGVFAFDVAVVKLADGQYRFPAIECNPRFNGASYPTVIAQRLGISAWTALALGSQHTNLDDIDLSGLEYSEAKQSGIVIVNWGAILVGKLVVLFAGTPQQQQQLQQDLQARL